MKSIMRIWRNNVCTCVVFHITAFVSQCCSSESLTYLLRNVPHALTCVCGCYTLLHIVDAVAYIYIYFATIVVLFLCTRSVYIYIANVYEPTTTTTHTVPQNIVGQKVHQMFMEFQKNIFMHCIYVLPVGIYAAILVHYT